jgi:RNA polymerase sigma-70 factor (ECF subfamily)
MNYEDAEEVTQESFITGYISLRTLRDKSKFGHWIGGIVRRKSIYFLRKKVKKRENLECLRQDFATELTERQNVESPLESEIDEERRKSVLEAVLALPEKYREVIYMKYYRNLSYMEIGGFLGLTKSGVDTRLQRARTRLKAVLGQKGIHYEL